MSDWEDLELDGATVRIARRWLSRERADRIFEHLRHEVDWRPEELAMFGRVHVVPRLVAWQGDLGATYRYSGRTHTANGWTPNVRDLRDALERDVPATRFDSALLNLYRDGQDSMGWHADDEPELGPRPVIASVSLGAERVLRWRRKRDAGWETAETALPHGSLLIMSGDTQSLWQHSLPRRARVTEPRINLTFRDVGTSR